jgi:uncharacterized protein YuzE
MTRIHHYGLFYFKDRPKESDMEENVTTPVKTEPILRALPYLTRFPSRRFWIDYDQEADVLYISFKRPQNATDSKMSEEGILYRYRDEELVGLTILDVSSRTQG